jgi:hypothetical protein
MHLIPMSKRNYSFVSPFEPYYHYWLLLALFYGKTERVEAVSRMSCHKRLEEDDVEFFCYLMNRQLECTMSDLSEKIAM